MMRHHMDWLTRLLGRSGGRGEKRPVQVFITNTLARAKEVFIPHQAGTVSMYTCGPTMYGPAHIGNLLAYVFSDTLARTLQGAGYHVQRVINITDFGHLVEGGDGGEDKMTKGLRREGMELTLPNMRALAEKYTAIFLNDLEEVGIEVGDITFPRASDYIPEQIALIQTLEQKGYAYRTKDGIYYDTSRFPGYGKLGGIDPGVQKVGARVEQFKEKRNPADFVLWKPDPKLGWESPWGRGFPGWHIECSAMARSLLGQEIDIHGGGEDLIHIHHNNEIAQSEAASGRTFAHYWVHNAFLTMSGEKASKSLGNIVYLSEIIERGFHPLALRYFFLQAHYRTPLSFSWEALEAASTALERLWRLAREIKAESKGVSEPSEARGLFLSAMRDDLGTPQALSTLWDSLRSEEYAPREKWGLLEDADLHLGLSLLTPPTAEISSEVEALLARREAARREEDFAAADRIRDEIEKRGYRVDDGPTGTVLTKKVG